MANTQEEYINSLKRIKEEEEKIHAEIEDHRSIVEKEIKTIEDEMKESIDKSKIDGKKMVEKSISEAKTNASIEADRIIKDAENKSKSLSINSDHKMIKEIIEMLLKMQ